MRKYSLSILLVLGWLFILYEYAVRVSDSVIIDHLMHSFSVGPGHIGVLSAAYYIPYVLMQVPAGVMIDSIGLRRSWAMALLIIAVGCFVFSLSHTIGLAIIGRILMGVGSAFAWTGVVKLVCQLIAVKNRAFFVGLSMTLCMLGAIIGQAPWLYVTNILQSWQMPYHLAAYLGVALSLLLFLLTRSVTITSDDQKVSVILAHIFSVLRSKLFWLLAIYMTALSLTQTAFSALWAVEFLKRSYHYSPQASANLASCIWFGGIFGALMIGWLARFFQRQRHLLMLLGVITLILLIVVIFIRPAISPNMMALIFFMLGFLTNGTVVIYVMAANMVPIASASSVVGAINMVNMGGGALMQIVIGCLLSLSSSGAYLGNFYLALGAIPLILLLSTLSLFWIQKER